MSLKIRPAAATAPGGVPYPLGAASPPLLCGPLTSAAASGQEGYDPLSSLEGTWGGAFSAEALSYMELDLDPQGQHGTTTHLVNFISSSSAINTPDIFDDLSASQHNDDFALDGKGKFFGDSHEILLEFEVPVSNDFDSQWETQVVKTEEAEAFFGTDPMACFNPMDVEGKEKPKKTRKALPKLVMPSPVADSIKEEQQQTSMSLNTPAVQSVLDSQAAQTGFDLLEYVTNTELPVDDPTFLQLLGDVSPNIEMTAALGTIDLAAIAVVPSTSKGPSHGKRKVVATAVAKTSKRRRVATSTVTSSSLAVASSTSSDHAYITNYDSSTSAFSADDVKDAQYRRMRDLNNLASKRCRQNRKQKFETLLDEEALLREKNAELRKKCQHMEDLVGQLKKQFIEKVTNPRLQSAKAFDLEQLMSDKLGEMQNG